MKPFDQGQGPQIDRTDFARALGAGGGHFSFGGLVHDFYPVGCSGRFSGFVTCNLGGANEDQFK